MCYEFHYCSVLELNSSHPVLCAKIKMASTGNPLHDAKGHMIGLIRTAYDKEKSNEERSRNLQSEIDELEKERLILEKECSELEIRKNELEKKSSASSEARKMYGDVTSGDITHQDVVLSYQNHFTAAHRNLPKILDVPTKEAKFEAWTEASEIVEQSFDKNKEEIVSEMITKLWTALTNPPPTDKPLDINTSDLYKAFTVYIKKNEDKIKQVIAKNSPQEHNEAAAMFRFARDIIMQLDPEDYHSFIFEGMKRPKHYLQATASSAAISKAKAETEKKSKCHACGKKFELDKGDSPTYHLGYYWHQRHCRCVSCHKLVDENFVYYKKKSYCSHCLCCKCQKPIVIDEDVLETEQGQFHRNCLVCSTCHVFRNEMFQIGDNYICKKCYNDRSRKKR
ncbi:PREDICTED: uncharacterized protein LOC109587688 [Amphimedon queenslandica]|uniref:LIM zinc-binding domain-containing protein n=1 Tax=Amphimedon queenslandica TaxID=400682 RepID=A0AAN0JRJ6_AMPQE|nr:PREDICTED: uncharacterized protein LOC109587688 [Amphimedon queenslandica]|eukprot:XP_019859469.1 PREDICTED: uncharacterized protein LOC109587688 [Amphimedon queenslandica]